MDHHHLRAQRKGAVLPSSLLSTYTESQKHSFNQSDESDAQSFEDELESWLEMSEEIPSAYQEIIEDILNKKLIPISIISSQSLDFFEEARQSVTIINQDYLNGAQNSLAHEGLLIVYCKLLFVMIFEYGNEVALKKMVELWNLLSEKSPISDDLKQYLQFVVSDKVFPLSCIQNNQSKSVLSKHLEVKCREFIQHNVPQVKARKIYND